MTTLATEDGIDQHPDLQELEQPQAESTPRRRGRPKGSRNKPKETATATTAAATPTIDTPTARVVLIEDGTVTVVHDKGTSTFAVESKFVLDRRSK